MESGCTWRVAETWVCFKSASLVSSPALVLVQVTASPWACCRRLGAGLHSSSLPPALLGAAPGALVCPAGPSAARALYRALPGLGSLTHSLCWALGVRRQLAPRAFQLKLCCGAGGLTIQPHAARLGADRRLSACVMRLPLAAQPGPLRIQLWPLPPVSTGDCHSA